MFFLSTSESVQSDMKDWVVSDAGDRWTVKLDVRDLGGHLDSTSGATVPLRILRTMHVPVALHGAEASQVSISGLRRLRTAFCQTALSGGLRLANPSAVLSLLDGLVVSDPGFHVVWCGFRMLRRHIAYNSPVHELGRFCSLLRVVAAGAPGHGPVHLLLSGAASLGFSWDPELCVWLRPGLPALCQVSSPFQFFREAIWGAWRTKVAGDLRSRAGFRGGRYLDFRGSLKLLSSPHLRGGDKGLLRGILSGVFGMDFLSALSQEKSFLVVVVGDLMVMGICFGSVLISLLFTFVRVPNFVIFCFVTGVLGLGVFFGMGGCVPLLAPVEFLLGLPRMMMLLLLGWEGC